jgi:hypothetical protein
MPCSRDLTWQPNGIDQRGQQPKTHTKAIEKRGGCLDLLAFCVRIVYLPTKTELSQFFIRQRKDFLDGLTSAFPSFV